MHFRVARGARGDTAVADELPLARSPGRNPFACACRRNLRPGKANALRIAESNTVPAWWTCGSQTGHLGVPCRLAEVSDLLVSPNLVCLRTEASPACQSLFIPYIQVAAVENSDEAAFYFGQPGQAGGGFSLDLKYGKRGEGCLHRKLDTSRRWTRAPPALAS